MLNAIRRTLERWRDNAKIRILEEKQNDVGLRYSELLDMAWLLERRGDKPKALSYYSRAHDALPEDEEALFHLARVHLSLRAWEEALIYSDKLLRLQKQHFQGMRCRGRALRGLGRYAEAKAVFTELIKPDGDFSAREELAALNFEIGLYAEVISGLQGTTPLESLPASSLLILGDAFLLSGDFERADNAFREALRKQPRFAEALMGRVVANYESNNYGVALVLVKEFLKDTPNDAQALVNMGRIYKELKDFKLAEAAFVKALAVDKENTGAMESLAWLYATTNLVSSSDHRRAKALEFAKMIQERDSDLTNARKLSILAAAYALNGEFELAIKVQEAAVESYEGVQREKALARLAIYRARERLLET